MQWNVITPSEVLGTGTPFYSGPQDYTCSEIILDRPFIKINGAIVMPFLNEIFDGRLEINSMPKDVAGIDLSWHIDWTTPVGVKEVDLYSVTLHEALHILGFASRIDLNDAYSLWDRLLHTTDNFIANGVSPNILPTLSNSSPEFPCTTNQINCWSFLNNFNISSLIDNTCDGNIGTPDVVVGENAIAAIDWANSGSNSAAMSHLSETCNGSTPEVYVMRGGFDPGMERRTLSSDELQILCEIGYTITSPSFPCTGCYSIANSDGIAINSCCSQAFHGCPGESIEILNSELLCNDVTNGSTLTITRVWVENPQNSNFVHILPNSSGTGWLITFDPNTNISGSQAFNYTIVGCDCRMHNASFRIIIENQCPECIYDGEMCENLLCYEDFENYTTANGIETWLGYPFLIEGNIRVGTPDINLMNGNQYLFMGGGIGFPNAIEPVTLELNKCIPPSCSLTLNVDLASTNAIGTLGVWGSSSPPCPATEAPAMPIADNCNEITLCSPNHEFIPVCIGNLPVPGTISNLADFDFGPANHITHVWENSSDQNICYLTMVPNGWTVYLDNISAQIICVPEIICNDPLPQNVCQGGIANISFEVCAPDIPECLDFTLITPSLVLPPGWTIVGGYPDPFILTEGDCQTITLQVQVPPNAPLGSMEMIMLSGTATGLCTTVEWSCAAKVTVIDCPDPQGFTCPCDSVGLNIDASDNSPYYDPILGGTLYSALEAAFDYDQDNDGKITQLEHKDCIAILGNLIVDQTLSISNCDSVKMQPCSEITVGTDTLELNNNNFSACEIMWRGITVTPFATLNFKGNLIEDAQFANTAVGGFGFLGGTPTKLIAVGNTFSNNHVGVFFPSQGIVNIDHLPFTDNTFNTTGTLLPPCDANLPNYSAQNGYAGAVTLGAPMTVGTPGNSGFVNTFQLLRNGVIADGAHLNVHRANFQNIAGAEIPTPPSFASSSGNGVAAIGGNVTVLNCNFNTVRRGISGHNNWQLTVRNNAMTAMWRGVETLGAHNSNISDNPSIGFADRGIFCRELIPAGPFFGAHRIANNTNMFTSPFPGNAGTPFPPFPAAIEIDNAMSVDVGSARITNNHFFSGGVFSDGIRVNGAGGWDIDSNTVDFQNPSGVNFSNNGIGIQLTNTHANYLYQNTINDLDQTFRASTGLSLSIGTGNRYCCNTTHGSRYGSRFLGACGSTEWRVTDMLDHEFALECGPGTVISPQLDYGDNFNITSGTAFHGGSDAQVFNSRFRVLNMQQPHWPETIATPNATGQFFTQPGSDASCTAPCTAPMFAPPPPDRDIDESDLTTASDGYASGQYGASLQWESGRRLYERMSDYEGMAGANTTTDAFFAAAGNGKTGAYYQAEHAAKRVYNYPENIAEGLQDAAAQLEANRLAVSSLLAGLPQAQTAADSALIYDNANAQYQQGQAAVDALQQYQAQAQGFQNAQALDAYQSTLPLPADNLLEQNRKTVQRLYLQTLCLGIAQLSQQQLAQAEAIAVQCPLEGGSAVYAARALYRLNIDRVFVDDSLCIETQERRQAQAKPVAHSEVYLLPNPATDMVTVAGLGSSAENLTLIQLVDANGTLRLQRRTAEHEWSFSVASLPSGIYFCRAQLGDAKPVLLKLVVSH